MHGSWRDLNVKHDAWTAFVGVFVMHFLARNSWREAIEFATLLFVVLLITGATITTIRRHRATTAPTTAPQLHTKRGI